MSISILIPIILGVIAALVVNYLADVLPVTLRLSKPSCLNPDCQTPYQWSDYLTLRKCPACSKPRSTRTYFIFLLCIITSLYLWIGRPAVKLGYFLNLLVLVYLFVVAVIDLENRLILQPLSISGVILAGLTGILQHGWLATLLGGIAGFAIMGFFYLIGKLFTRMRARRLGQDPRDAEEALGSGDVTLAIILGLFLGWPLIWFGLVLGVLFAGFISLVIILVLVISRKYKQQALMVFIPFGPAFVLSTILLVYLPNWIRAVLPG
jgi:leader peptidase (prepilin peptidase)/N-methyltransferase